MLLCSPRAVNTTPVAQATPARTGQPIRSKGGCLTCKAKHSKCDETRPTCKRCAAKGLECRGYVSKAAWTFKHLVFQPDTIHSPGLSSSTKSVSPATEIECRTSPSIDSTSKRSPLLSRHSKQHRRLSAAPYPTPAATATPLPRIASTDESVQRTLCGEPQPQVPVSPTARHGAQQIPSPTTSLSTDNASAFIINWFRNVCPAWSGFDSDVNYNRKIAIDLWQSSAVVKTALESMSASFFASQVPRMRQASLQLMSRATEFIQTELNMIKNQAVLHTIPTGVIFAMFCLGTTICWVDSRGLGLPFFRELRALLRRLNAQLPTDLRRSSLELLDFFNQSMVYCDMLLAVVSDDEEVDLVSETPPMAALEPNIGLASPNMLHPWTGVSTLSAQLFAESVRLCRRSRARLRHPFHIGGAYHAATLDDLPLAQVLEERLLALEIDSESRKGSNTGDLVTPQSHLNMTAEAYRIAALLHLYQTFHELALQRLPIETADAGSPSLSDATLWDEWIVPLALHLVKILRQIPPSSGSRVIQPLLYISAATGLRHGAAGSATKHAEFGSFPSSSMSEDEWRCRSQMQQSVHDPDTLISYITRITSSGNGTLPGPEVSNVFLEISRARNFILERLGIFETSLPPAPIVVAKELVSTIWKSYDNTHDLGDGLYMVHWIDVMEMNDLRSMFG